MFEVSKNFLAGVLLVIALYYENLKYYASFVIDLIIFYIRGFIVNIFSTGLVTRYHGKNYIDISYYDGPSFYTVRIPKRRGMRNYDIVMDENSINVTSNITKYIGPYHNFHGIKTTPSILGYQKLTFINLLRNTEKIFTADEDILL